jgi:polyhydroxyalkanoate synthesis repressor PhaR
MPRGVSCSRAAAGAAIVSGVRDVQSTKANQAEPSDAESPSTGAPTVRVIKKYPNRRLYDTDSSSYITLSDVKALVMRAEPFVVRDAKTGEDLTRAILLQIILEEETAGVPLFSEKMLANIIRFYGHAMQDFMGSYLERNLQIFMELQQKMAEQAKELTPELWQQFMAAQPPLAMSHFFAQQQKAFAQMQEQMLSAFGIKRPH